MTDTEKLAREFLLGMSAGSGGKLLNAAINGSIDSYIARETVNNLTNKDGDTITMREIRAARNKALGGYND